MLEVVGHRLEAAAAEIGGPEDDAHDAAALGDAAEGIVVEVPPRRPERGHPGVGAEDARLLLLQERGEQPPRGVRHVDGEPARRQGPQHPCSEGGQAPPAPEGERRASELVGDEVGEAHEGDAPAGELTHPLHPPLNRVAALDAEDAGHPPLRAGLEDRREPARAPPPPTRSRGSAD